MQKKIAASGISMINSHVHPQMLIGTTICGEKDVAEGI